MDPIVETNSGSVRGLIEKHEDGFDYYAFKGIPFAEPPIGELRFEDPVPKKKWTGILDCQNFGPVCLQHDYLTGQNYYDEDCLHLNVYTRSINNSNKSDPAIVWIHGGEGTYGSADDVYCGPDYLIRKNIVLVTPNFRVGVIGFLDLEDEVAPGNQGLKDLVMALQWVQQNIRKFGGDPNNVTVGGVTGGAAFAHYLALSSLTKNLMHKLICHGSVVYNPWIGTVNPRSDALKFCSLLGKSLTDSKEIVKFLKTVDAKVLLDAQQRLRDTLTYIPFGVGLDSKASVPFLPLDRYIAADQGVQLPCLVGYAAREGLIILYDPYVFRTISRKEYFASCDSNFGNMFNFNSRHVLERYNVNEKQVKRLYYKNEVVSEKNIDKFVDIAGDIYFAEGIHRFVRIQTQLSSSPTYLFRFDYDSEYSMKTVMIKDKMPGACHYDDIPYLFKMGLVKNAIGKHFEKGSESYKVMEQMTEMWANFATYGPTVETSDLIPVQWQPVNDGTNFRYMNIGEDMTMQSTINVEQKFLSAKSINA